MSFETLSNLVRSTSFRIAAMFMSLFLASVVVISLFVYTAIESYLRAQASTYVDTMLAEGQGFLNEGGLGELIAEIDERAQRGVGAQDIYVLFDQDCAPIVKTLPRLPPDLLAEDFCASTLAAGGRAVFDISRAQLFDESRSPGEAARESVVSRIVQIDSGAYIYAARIVPEIYSTRQFVGRILLGGVLLVLVLGSLGAAILTNTIARRLEKINRISLQVRQGNLGLRIAVDNSGDEFDRLAQNLNMMLDRIEYLVEGMKQVSNNVAHDLRTPLTRVQGHLEYLNQFVGDDEAATQLVQKIIEETDEILAIFSALLEIAGLESKSAKGSFNLVDLDQIIEDVVDLYEPMALEKHIDISCKIDTIHPLRGDRNLLFQALGNIVDNAIKYTPPGKPIEIRVTEDAGFTSVIVKDSGPGIPEEMRQKVLERFYRLELHRKSPGNGLGLSLVQAIARYHSGEIKLSGDRSGLVFSFRIPYQAS